MSTLPHFLSSNNDSSYSRGPRSGRAHRGHCRSIGATVASAPNVELGAHHSRAIASPSVVAADARIPMKIRITFLTLLLKTICTNVAFDRRADCSKIFVIMVRVPYNQEVWVGNIPQDMTEQKVTDELALYDIFPHKVILRYDGRPDGYAILAFASVALAEQT